MKIQTIADIHLEFTDNLNYLVQNPVLPVAPTLLIAGDMAAGNLSGKHVSEFLDYCADMWEQVIIILGNHEFYGSSISVDTTFPTYEKILHHPNIKVVNNITVMIEDCPIICSTLWSRIQPQNEVTIMQAINDYRWIKGETGVKGETDVPLTTFMVNKFYSRSLWYLEREVVKYDRCIVMTHHAPSIQCQSPQHFGSAVSDAFVNHLDSFIIGHPQIKLWIHGHTHNSTDMMIGTTHVVSNQLGYVKYGEHTDFQHETFIEVA